MTVWDTVSALLAITLYNLYWRHLPACERFIRRNKLVPARSTRHENH